VKDKWKKILHIFAVACAAAVFEVFGILCLGYFHDLGNTLYHVILIGGTVWNFALFVVEAVFFLKQKELIYKSCIIAYCLLVLAAVVFFVMLKTGFMEIARDDAMLEEYLKRAGVWMVPSFILLQFLQVVILPIPSTVTVLAGSALFGPLRGSLYSLIGIVAGSLVAFLIGKYAGNRVVEWLVGKETLDKWMRKIKGKDKLLLSAMFLLPVFPDDVLCFVAGISSMTLPMFLIVICISRVLAIFVTSFSVTLIPWNTWWGLLIWAAIFVAVIVLFLFLYKRIDDIQNWILKRLHRETRIQKRKRRRRFAWRSSTRTEI